MVVGADNLYLLIDSLVHTSCIITIKNPKLSSEGWADDFVTKRLLDEGDQKQYLVHLCFQAQVVDDNAPVRINNEWVEHRWISWQEIFDLDLNPPSQRLFSFIQKNAE